ncbi:MAG: DUF3887 domain-containing protein [Xenococcus sp. (in: cyanobacteria)]
MKSKITKLHYLSLCLILFTSILSGTTAIFSSSKAIAQIAQSEQTQDDSVAQAGTVAQAMFDSLIAGEFEQTKEYLSPSINDYLTTDEIAQYWQNVIDKMGAFVEYKKIRPTKIFDTYTVLVSARFSSKITDFSITLDSNQQVTSVDFLWIGNVQENAENFVDALTNGNYTAARGYLEPKLKETLLPENLEQAWQEILEETGSFIRRSDSRRVESSSSNLVLVNLEFEKENRSFMIIFNPLKQIIGVDFPEPES